MQCGVVFITVPNKEVGLSLAKGLVEQGYCACVNLLSSLTSIYMWQGQLCQEDEWLLIGKTVSDRWPHLEQWVKENHPYECPEIIFLPIDKGYSPYLEWVKAAVNRAS